MSGTSQVLRPAGPTICLSVVATAHAAVPIAITGNDVASFVSVINTGTVAVGIKFSVAGTLATLAIDGTPGDFVLPGLMQQAVILPLPASAQGAPCQVSAIGSAAGPSLVYITPLVMQT